MSKQGLQDTIKEYLESKYRRDCKGHDIHNNVGLCRTGIWRPWEYHI